MRPRLAAVLIVAGLMAVLPLASVAAAAACPGALDFRVRPLGESQPVRLCDAYGGKVVLIVNTASKCAYTPQYDGLETLYEKYRERGLVVLGFPSNDFANQEPGSETQIKEFCRLTYGVRFPMFAKTRVSERSADPLYHALGGLAGEYPRWNFHKYLLDRNGKLIGSFPSRVAPDDRALVQQIESLL
ncbi:MAG: glutathione peroxidase [Pseudomonadota bacterium]|nr:MAG: glutathione peroxidase [Pseudomonadota bacterium]